jgi:hypothetical protein
MAIIPKNPVDPEDQQEAPETPGETPDAEDVAEGPEPDAENTQENTAEGGQEEPGEQGDDGSTVSPQEQRMYDAVVTACFGIMYNDNGFKILLQKLTALRSNMGDGIGHTAAMLIMSVRGGLKQQGTDIPGDVLYAAGQEVIENLVDIAVGAKLADETDRTKLTQQALMSGLKVFGNQEVLKSTADQRAQAAQDLQDVGVQATIDGKQVGAGANQAPAQAQPQAPAGGIVNAGTGASP